MRQSPGKSELAQCSTIMEVVRPKIHEHRCTQIQRLKERKKEKKAPNETWGKE
jgi:hypothetical protein